MPRLGFFVIELTDQKRSEPLSRSRRYTSLYRGVIRAKIVLLAGKGLSNEVIGAVGEMDVRRIAT